MGGGNNDLGLIGPYASLNFAFSMLILKNYYDDIPRDFIDAARIDGCRNVGVFRLVILPLTRPVMAVSVVMTFLFVWNEFLLGMLIMTRKTMQLITMAPMNFMGTYQAHIGKLFASLVFVALPTMALFFIMQNQFIKRMTAGSIKG